MRRALYQPPDGELDMYSSPPLHATGACRAVYVVTQRKIAGERTLAIGDPAAMAPEGSHPR